MQMKSIYPEKQDSYSQLRYRKDMTGEDNLHWMMNKYDFPDENIMLYNLAEQDAGSKV